MRKCALCAAKIPSGGIYCPACGKKVESAITFDYREEDEREFAFHAEYYGAAGTNRGEQQMLHGMMGNYIIYMRQNPASFMY